MRLKNRRNSLLYHNEKRGVTILRSNKPVYLACVIQILQNQMERALAPSGSTIHKIISKTIIFDVEKILKKVTSARFVRK